MTQRVTPRSQAETESPGITYPTPLTLLGWGLAVALLATWLVVEGLEEGSAFITWFGILVAAPAWAVTAVGVIGQGVRFGMTWVDHDRQAAVGSRQ